MRECNTQLLTKDDYKRWDAYVERANGATPFHRIAWLKTVQEVYGHVPCYLIAVDGDTVCGILPLFIIAGPVVGRTMTSSPFVSAHCGICADAEDIAQELIEKAEQMASHYGVSYCELKNIQQYASKKQTWHVKKDYCTMVICFSNSKKEIWNAFSRSTQKNIKRCEKLGMTLENDARYYDEFYHIVALSMKRLGTPVHSKRFYRKALDHFGSAAQLFVIRSAGKTIAGKLSFAHNKTVYSLVSAIHPEYRDIRPNDFLNWNVYQWAMANGVQCFDFGRSVWHSGTFEFKKRMGAEPIPVYYEYYLRKRRDIPQVHQDNVKFTFAIETWKRLPLWLTKMVGPHLIKYVV